MLYNVTDLEYLYDQDISEHIYEWYDLRNTFKLVSMAMIIPAARFVSNKKKRWLEILITGLYDGALVMWCRPKLKDLEWFTIAQE